VQRWPLVARPECPGHEPPGSSELLPTLHQRSDGAKVSMNHDDDSSLTNAFLCSSREQASSNADESQAIASLREENLRLVATVLKNNEDIRRLGSRLDEICGENRRLTKQNLELEERIGLCLKEIKLIYADMEKMQSHHARLQSTST